MSKRQQLIILISGALITFIRGPAPVSAGYCDPFVDHWEFTQAVQHVDPANPMIHNSVPLVDGRPLAVRAYLAVREGCEPAFQVDGQLEVLEGGQVIHHLHWSSTGPVPVVNDEPQWDRSDRESSLNYLVFPRLSTQASAGYRDVQFRLWLFGQTEAEPTSPPARLHTRHTRFELVGVPLPYEAALPDPLVPMPGIGDRMLHAVYPYPLARGYELDAPFDDFPDRLEEIAAARDQGTNINLYPNVAIEALTQYAALDGLRCRPARVFGWLPDATFARNGFWPRNTVAGFGNADLRNGNAFMWNLAHEWGHGGMGWAHPKPTEPNQTDEIGWDALPYIPWKSGHATFAEYPVKNIGLDELMNAPSGAPEALDYWTRSDDRYVAAFSDLTRPGLPTCELLVEPVRTIIGQIPGDGSVWSLSPSFEIPGYAWAESIAGSPAGEVRVLDASGGVLHSEEFEPPTPETTDDYGVFSVRIPSNSGLEAIEVYENGQLKASLQRTANSPAVTVTSPVPGATLDANTVVQWSASDADGDDMVAAVLYSADGQEWHTITSYTSDSSVALSPDSLPSSTAASIRVLVSDGINTTGDSVDTLTLLPNRVPTVVIAHPHDGGVYLDDTNVILYGSGVDPEDGVMSGAALQWYADGQLVGVGSVLNTTNLSPGTYPLELRASDSGGALASDSVTITVQ